MAVKRVLRFEKDLDHAVKDYQEDYMTVLIRSVALSQGGTISLLENDCPKDFTSTWSNGTVWANCSTRTFPINYTFCATKRYFYRAYFYAFLTMAKDGTGLLCPILSTPSSNDSAGHWLPISDLNPPPTAFPSSVKINSKITITGLCNGGPVALMSHLGSYLSVCNGCVKDSNYTERAEFQTMNGTYSKWLVKSEGNGTVSLQNLGTNTFLHRCHLCYKGMWRPDAAFVNYKNSSPESARWTLSQLTGGNVALFSNQTRFYLALCDNCALGESNPFSAFVSATEPAHDWVNFKPICL